jgi:hypothetical protein
MSADQTNIASATSGELDAYIARLMQETGATSVLFKIEPNHPGKLQHIQYCHLMLTFKAAANSTGSGTTVGGTTFNSIEECVAHIKNETGVTAVMFEIKPNHSGKSIVRHSCLIILMNVQPTTTSSIDWSSRANLGGKD